MPEPLTFLLHRETADRIDDYLFDLAASNIKPGVYLARRLESLNIGDLAPEDLLTLLIDTKKPQIFAESSVFGDGSDWNLQELSILGDISAVVPVTVYDDGLHRSPMVHSDPFHATLVYVPGALLRNDTGNKPADWDEVVQAGGIEHDAYAGLIERRLLPPLLFINSLLQQKGKQGFVTIPGLGCGQFAGEFHGLIGGMLRAALLTILQRNVTRLPNIKAVYFDPYRECENERQQIGHLSFMVRPLTKSTTSKPQLCHPVAYEEANDDFSNCELCSIVAWDHVSWPGNDFYLGSRATDDGVKAAATSSMYTVTGIRGLYDAERNTYSPPDGYRTWGEVVSDKGLRLNVEGRVVSFA